MEQSKGEIKSMTEPTLQIQRVLYEMKEVRIHNTPYFLSQNRYATNHIVSGGWRPAYFYQTAACGGSDATRQIRFLANDHGVPVEGHGIGQGKTHTYFDGSGRKRQSLCIA